MLLFLLDLCRSLSLFLFSLITLVNNLSTVVGYYFYCWLSWNSYVQLSMLFVCPLFRSVLHKASWLSSLNAAKKSLHQALKLFGWRSPVNDVTVGFLCYYSALKHEGTTFMEVVFNLWLIKCTVEPNTLLICHMNLHKNTFMQLHACLRFHV